MVVHILIDALKQNDFQSPLTANIKNLIHYWKGILDVSGAGILDSKLDQFVITENDRESILRVLQLSKRAIGALGPTISATFLDRVVGAPQLFRFVDRPTIEVLAAFDKFIDILSPQ
jgi:hypothetical protein